MKLGKLPNSVIVRLSISMPTTLKARVERYAALHSETYEQTVDAVALIPHIVEQFLASDRAFRKLERELVLKSSEPQ